MFEYIEFVGPVYLAIGAAVSRRHYAIHAGGQSTAQSEMEQMKHGHSCYQNPSNAFYTPSRGCDCSMRGKWLTLRAKTRGHHFGPYVMMVAYPILGFDAWLKGGKVKAKVEKREALIAQIDQMDRELGLGPYADNS